MRATTLLIILLISLTVVKLTTAANVTLSATYCSGASSCTLANYPFNDTSIGHVVAKSETGTADNWTDASLGGGDTIDYVGLQFRHNAQTGIEGAWTITFQSEDGLTSYCSDNTIAHDPFTEYIEVDFTSGCGWTASRLDDLEITFASGDKKGSQNAYLLMARVIVEYTEGSATCDCPSSGTDWTINDGSNCDLTTTCDIGTGKLYVNDGSMRVGSGGNLYAAACYVTDTEYIYVDDGGVLYCQ